jgi:hypothetical protein
LSCSIRVMLVMVKVLHLERSSDRRINGWLRWGLLPKGGLRGWEAPGALPGRMGQALECDGDE